MRPVIFLLGGLLVAASLFPFPTHAEYHSFNVGGNSDGVVQEVRWPYWAETTYNAIYSQYISGSDGDSCYFYGGMPSDPAGHPPCSVIWSFWPPKGTSVAGAAVSASWTATNMYAPPHVGEGASGKTAGQWPLIRSNCWYREVLRVWQPTDGTPHLGFTARWLRDSATGNWFHVATMKVPFSATGISGLGGFQEDFSHGNRNPRRTDFRNVYYHNFRGGAWQMANQFTPENNCNGISGLIENGTASFFELCGDANYLQGMVSNPPPTTGKLILFVDPDTAAGYMLTNPPSNTTVYNWTTNRQPATIIITNQPVTPSIDPIVVSSSRAAVSGHQLVAQWQLPATSSPQFAYQVEVFNNAGCTGSPAVSFHGIDPEARQKLMDITGVTTPYVRLTIIDIMNVTNPPILITPVTTAPSPARNVPGAVNGLAYKYYESRTNFLMLPNYAALTPVYQGAVDYPDLTPRRQRTRYAFNYTGFINVPADGLYTFTLISSDGSRLLIDGATVVNWDGEHSPGPMNGWAALAAGMHPVNVQYFFDNQNHNAGDLIDSLAVTWGGTGIAAGTAVPASAWFRAPGGGEPAVTLITPANDSTVCCTNVQFNAGVTPRGTTINNIQFYLGNNYWGQASAAPFHLNASVWASAGNAFRARLFYNNGYTLDSRQNLAATTNMTLAPWLLASMSDHVYPNGAQIAGGTYTLLGDGLNLLGRQVTGDCTLIARRAGIISFAAGPDGQTPGKEWSAGIMLRGSTNSLPGTPLGNRANRYACVYSTVGGGAHYEDDTMANAGGPHASRNLGSYSWYQIQRAGDTFTTSLSNDGVTWTKVNTNTLSGIGMTIYVGVFTYAASSQNPNVHWASFDSVSLTGNALDPARASDRHFNRQ